MNRFLLLLSCFTVMVAGPRSRCLADDSQDAKRALGRWVMEYYMHPDPERFVDRVKEMSALGILYDGSPTGNPDRNVMFLGKVMEANPERIREWMDGLASLPADDRKVLERAAWYSGTPEGTGWLEEHGEGALARGPRPRLLSEPRSTQLKPHQLDELWEWFFATGEEEPVARIVSVFSLAHEPPRAGSLALLSPPSRPKKAPTRPPGQDPEQAGPAPGADEAALHRSRMQQFALVRLALWSSASLAHQQDRVLEILKHLEAKHDDARAKAWLARVIAIAESQRAKPEGVVTLLTPDEVLRTLNARLMASAQKSNRNNSAEAAEQAVSVAELQYGKDAAETAVHVSNLAYKRFELGLYAEAATLSKRALAIREKTLGMEHPETASSLDQLASIYQSQGRLDAAEPLYKRAIDILERTRGRDALDTAIAVNNLATLFSAQGNQSAAEPLYARALAIQERIAGAEDPGVAMGLDNLAEVYRDQGRTTEAERLFRRALAIREKALEPGAPDTGNSLSHLGQLQESTGDYKAAESFYRRAHAIYEKSLGPGHPATAATLGSLARLFTAQGDFTAAEPLLQQALTIEEKAFGLDHAATTETLSNLASLRVSLGQFPAAATHFDRARRGTRRYVARVLPSLSAAEQAVFLRTQDERNLHAALTLGLSQRASPRIATLSAGWLANGKAVAQEAASQRMILARQSRNPRTKAVVTEIERVRAKLARLSQIFPVPQAQLAELQAEEQRLVHEIGGQLAALDRSDPWVEIAAIRDAIPAGSVLVDIARFSVRDFSAPGTARRGKTDRYAAWIIPPTGAADVTIVDLGDATEIDGLVTDYRRGIEAIQADLPAARPLADRVLRPILAALPAPGNAVEELIVSPDGALWLVPWQALPLEDGAFAIERYAIRTVTSGRDLVPPPGTATPRGESSAPLVVADPAFDEPSAQRAAAEDTPAGDSPLEGSSRVLAKVEALPATRHEAEAARIALAGLAGIQPTVRLGRDATAAAVQREAVRPKALVLATHGFFLPNQQVSHEQVKMQFHTRGIAGTRPLATTKGKSFEDPLLRCGLLFTGANLPVTKLLPGGDDGALTGAEIVGLDLSGTDFVVLSACDTGVGRVDVGEGVACLRQAFQIAGAKSVVATLWQVPDTESAETMVLFYRNLAAGQPTATALRGAQLAFIRARRQAGGREADHPHSWAAYGVTGR